jgi:hypothetical protein
MGANNKYFQTPYSGLGLDLYWEGRPFTNTTAGQYTFESQKVGKHDSFNNSLPYIKTSILSKVKTPTGRKSNALFVTSNLNVNNDEQVNKTSLLDIIAYLQQWESTYVDFADFAYLKNLGVYPSNRLMIARRFSAPTPNNLYKVKDSPIATLVSWMQEDEDFLSISFKEEWESNDEYSFTNLLGDLYGDVGGDKTKARKSIKGGFGLLPLPAITEVIQAKIRQIFGLSNENDPDYNVNNLPSGNPNLIKESSRRQLVDPERTGSGVVGKFSIKFKTEYELKYINGVDPSMVYLDIIQNALAFGTARSVSILGSGIESSGSVVIQNLIKGDYKEIQKTIGEVIGEITKVLTNQYDDFKKQSQNNNNGGGGSNNQQGATGSTASILEIATDIVGQLGSFAASKYRTRLLSILQLMTGAPSAYWHITIGNPKKPILSSGDMICKTVTLKLGKVLSYNDLPSTISIDFELESARNLGGQEIFDRMNTGQSRTYFNRRRAYYDEFFSKGSGEPGKDSVSLKERQDKFINYTEAVLGEDGKDNPGPKFEQIRTAGFTEGLEQQELRGT